MSNPSKSFEFIRLYPQLAADPVQGRVGEIYYNTSTNSLRVCISSSPLLWKSLGSGGGVTVDLYDPISTTLPSGPSATIDGVSVTNGMDVLFSSLGSGNFRVYKVSGVGTSMVWTVQANWPGGTSPVAGDRITVRYGTSFGLQNGIFTGTGFSFNDVVRFFSGTDYWELSSLKTFAFNNNTTTNVFTVGATGSENIVIDFSVIRNTGKHTGSIYITTDGTTVSFSSTGSFLATIGVTFNVHISGPNLLFDLIADNSGTNGTLKYFLRRWSDNPGGPGGPPSYSTGPISPVAAAGSSGDVQFNSSSLLGADANFKWDGVEKAINLNSFKIAALTTPFTLLDNTISAIIATVPVASRFITISFGIYRNGSYRVGRMFIVNSGALINYQDDSIETNDTGIALSATLSGGNVEIRYTSTSTGFNGFIRYSITKFGE